MKHEQLRNRMHVRLGIYAYGWNSKGRIRRIQLQKASKRYFGSPYWKHSAERAILKLADLRRGITDGKKCRLH